MIYINEGEALIFDTPVNDSASEELIKWLAGIKILGVVVSHFHIDCLGGLRAFHHHEIPSHAQKETIRLADSAGRKVLPQLSLELAQTFKVGKEKVWARYYGPGHTKDNMVAYIPNAKTLFGGCLLKALKAPKGNLADARPQAWSRTVAAIKSDLPQVEYVIPGHGQSGDGELLDYTIELFHADAPRYVFFLHNRFLESHALEAEHPEYGRVEYAEILEAFKEANLVVRSEKRRSNVNARDYAVEVIGEIEALMQQGVPAENITVIGTSKGGYIAQYVSSLAQNPKLNFVFIASYRDSDLLQLPDLQYCGRILTIYEKSDPFGVSAVARKNQSKCEISAFEELALDTGLKHGFLFKALPEWLNPCVKWAKGSGINN